MPSQVKIELVSELKDQMARAKSIVLSDYRGLTVEQMTNLRVKLRGQGAEMRVIKNRLAKLAMKDAGLPVPEDHLTGPSAFVFSMEDPTAGPKVLTQFAKDNVKLSIKCGLFERSVMNAAAVATLASLPSREELLGRLLGGLKSPVARFAICLKATVNKVAYALKAVADKKQAAA